MPTIAQYSLQLSRVIPAVGGAEVPGELIRMLRSLVGFDDASILLYPGSAMPVVEYCEKPPGTGSSTLDVFIRGAFLLDPYYQAASHDNSFGVFRLRDLAPSGFRESEYYRSWYRDCGYQDECGYLVSISDTGFVNIALGRTSPRAKFTVSQQAVFRAILPVVDTLCQQHWSEVEEPAVGVNLRTQLNSALACFGSSLLTERETQVINLVLHGHSTRTLAEKLSISTETVKLHRKHAYAKLEVSSQAELFYLFLDSVMSARDYQGGDTLIAYLHRPQTPPD